MFRNSLMIEKNTVILSPMAKRFHELKYGSAATVESTDSECPETMQRQEPIQQNKMKPQIAVKEKIKEQTLSKWTLAISSKGGLMVQGHRKGDPPNQFWHSTSIVKRHNNRRLATFHGSIYVLSGPIDCKECIGQGIPEDLIEKFSDGFPPDWRELWQEYMNKSNNNSKEEESHQQTKPEIVKTTKPQKSRSLQSPKIAKNTKDKNTQKKENGFQSPRTPGEVIDLSKLPVTRSGRKVVPPLDWWCGERMKHTLKRGVYMEGPHVPLPAEKSFHKNETKNTSQRNSTKRKSDASESESSDAKKRPKVESTTNRKKSTESKRELKEKKPTKKPKETVKEKKPKGNKKSNNPKVTQLSEITGGVGTLKRTRQLREFMEHQDEGHEDDLFDSSLHRKSAKNIRLALDDDSDEEFFKQKALLCHTPGAKPRTPLPYAPTPNDKTPHCDFLSPGILKSVNRNEVDAYVRRLKKGHRRVSRMRSPAVPCTGKSFKSTLVGISPKAALFKIQDISDQDESMDCDQDYYFSSDDQS